MVPKSQNSGPRHLKQWFSRYSTLRALFNYLADESDVKDSLSIQMRSLAAFEKPEIDMPCFFFDVFMPESLWLNEESG